MYFKPVLNRVGKNLNPWWVCIAVQGFVGEIFTLDRIELGLFCVCLPARYFRSLLVLAIVVTETKRE